MNKDKMIIISASIATGGLFYIGYTIYKKGFDDGAKHVGKELFNGHLTVEETDEDGNVATKVVEPVLWPVDMKYFDEFVEEFEFVDVVHR